jgi:malonyl-CoA O-methyltransferase
MSKPSASRTEAEFSLDRKALLRGFAKAAARSESSTRSLERLNAELLERLQYFELEPRHVLDLGAGVGSASLKLRERYPGAQVLAVDFALAMLEKAPRSWWPRTRFHRVAADATRLPFSDGRFDLVYSNLLLPFCDRPHLVFREIARVLREGGLLVFATLGPETLKELRSAWASVDDGAHVSVFPGLPQLGDALMHSGLREPVMDTEQHQLHYRDVRALMRELKDSGAQNSVGTRFHGLTGRGRLRAMVEAYEAVRTPSGIPATFEVIFGAAFASAPGVQGAHQGGTEVGVPLANLKNPFRR